MDGIKVIKNFNGFTGDLIEVIHNRKTKYIGNTRKNEIKRPTVSYKGKYYIVIILPKSYGDLSGRCITID